MNINNKFECALGFHEWGVPVSLDNGCYTIFICEHCSNAHIVGSATYFCNITARILKIEDTVINDHPWKVLFIDVDNVEGRHGFKYQVPHTFCYIPKEVTP